MLLSFSWRISSPVCPLIDKRVTAVCHYCRRYYPVLTYRVRGHKGDFFSPRFSTVRRRRNGSSSIYSYLHLRNDTHLTADEWNYIYNA